MKIYKSLVRKYCQVTVYKKEKGWSWHWLVDKFCNISKNLFKHGKQNQSGCNWIFILIILIIKKKREGIFCWVERWLHRKILHCLQHCHNSTLEDELNFNPQKTVMCKLIKFSSGKKWKTENNQYFWTFNLYMEVNKQHT